MYEFVTPAKDNGVQSAVVLRYWLCIPFGQIPAFAGMTATFCFIGPEQ